MSKRMPRWEKRLLLFLLALFLCLCHFTAANAHYAPPYHLNSAVVKEVSVYRYSHNYLSGKDISDRVQITRIVELLNHFKYIEKEEPLPMAGCGTTYSLCMKGGFQEIWIDFDSSRIFVEKRNKSGTEIFHGPPDYFQSLVELADSAAERD